MPNQLGPQETLNWTLAPQAQATPSSPNPYLTGFLLARGCAPRWRFNLSIGKQRCICAGTKRKINQYYQALEAARKLELEAMIRET